MEQALLTPEQRTAIAAIAAEEAMAGFYLTGGTALAAYHLGHRRSDDLDFFTAEKPDMVMIHSVAERLRVKLGAATARFQRLYDRNQFFFTSGGRELKVEFTYYPFGQLEAPLERDGIRVDGLRDIAANKMMALLDRFDPKDFVDLFFLLRQFPLQAMRRDAEQKFHTTIDPMFLGAELTKAKRIAALPDMIQPVTVPEIQERFTEEARRLAPDVLST